MNQNEQLQEMHRKQHQTEYVCRTKFARHGAISYVGHLDLKNIIDRAIRRAELPILYSQGFNPRPMVVFALPLGVGINTEGDYVDVSMSVPVDAETYLAAIRPELPDGLEFVECTSIDEPKNSIMSVVTCASYRLEAPGITKALLELWPMEEIKVEKMSKKKVVETDIRPLMIKQIPTATPDVAELMVYAGSTKNLRPDILLKAICKYTGYSEELAGNCIVTRTALYGGEYPEIQGIEGLV